MKPEQLLYAACTVCPCGAGLAYPPSTAGVHGEWACSRVLLGEVPAGDAHPTYPFAFYEIKSEGQPSANGATTRPAEQGRIRWKIEAACGACGHTWTSELREIGSWAPGSCPKCGNDHGADASTTSERPTPIKTRVRDWLVRPDGTAVEIERRP